MADNDATAGRPVAQLLISLAAAAVLLAAVRSAAAVVVPLLIALIITVIAAPAQTALARRGMRPGPAFVVVALGVTVVVGAFVALAYTALSQFLGSLPSYGPALDRLAASLYEGAEDAGINLHSVVPMPHPDVLLPAIASTSRGILADVTGGWLLVLGISLFMLFEARTFPAKVAKVVSAAQMERLTSFRSRLATSMSVLTVANLLVGLGNLVVLLVLGVPNALLWAALSFLLNYIPDIGFIISVIPPTVATLLHHGALAALGVLVAFIVINAAIDEIVYPRMLSTQLDLAPFWTLLSLVFWGWLLGIAGAILAIPLTMIVKLLLDSFDSTRPYGTLLASGRSIPKGSRGKAPS